MLIRLHEELQPRLRMALRPSTSGRVLRAALRELVVAMEIFNGRWQKWLAEVDLTAINKSRDDYNRYYLLEKEWTSRLLGAGETNALDHGEVLHRSVDVPLGQLLAAAGDDVNNARSFLRTKMTLSPQTICVG